MIDIQGSDLCRSPDELAGESIGQDEAGIAIARVADVEVVVANACI